MAKEKIKKADTGEAGTFTVRRRVKHGGRIYNEGEPIDLTDVLAAPLLAIGAIAVSGEDQDAQS